MKRERDPTPEEFEKLLRWLDDDRDVAGEKYVTLRSRLMRIFVVRGCGDTERLADEVMNRVAVRIDKLVAAYDVPAKCLQGFAENVYKEYRRVHREESLSEDLAQSRLSDERDQEALEQQDECLTRCISELSRLESDLFRRYFQEDRHVRIRARKKLGAELGLTANAIRIKAFRIRRQLRHCMELCLGMLPAMK
jgi:hypothetical protein